MVSAGYNGERTAPLPPLGSFLYSRIGPNPLLASGVVPKSFYFSPFALIRASFRCSKMSRETVGADEKLEDVRNLEGNFQIQCLRIILGYAQRVGKSGDGFLPIKLLKWIASLWGVLSKLDFHQENTVVIFKRAMLLDLLRKSRHRK